MFMEMIHDRPKVDLVDCGENWEKFIANGIIWDVDGTTQYTGYREREELLRDTEGERAVEGDRKREKALLGDTELGSRSC